MSDEIMPAKAQVEAEAKTVCEYWCRLLRLLLPVEMAGMIALYCDSYTFDRFLEIARKGAMMKKYTGKLRRRKPQERIVRLRTVSGSDSISWGSGSRHIPLDNIKYVAHGIYTPPLYARRAELEDIASQCFSVVGDTQILDVLTSSEGMTYLWVTGLRELIGQTDHEAQALAESAVAEVIKRVDKHEAARKARNRELFATTLTTVFGLLEEEGVYVINQAVRDHFDANTMHNEALALGIPRRRWDVWVRERILLRLEASIAHT